MTLPLADAIERFKANEERVQGLVNGDGYTTTSGTPVESLPDFLARVEVEIEQATGTVAANLAAAQQAVVDAEAAATAANSVGKIFPNVAAGIAGTTSGQSFSVLSGDLQDLIVYTNPSTTEVLRLKTKAYFDTVFKNGFTAERVGYLYAWVDSSGALLLGIKNDGTLWSKGVNISDAVANAASQSDVQLAVDTIIVGPTRSGYLIVFTDSSNRILGGLLGNGELEVKGVNISDAVATMPDTAAAVTPLPSIVIFGDSLTEGAGTTGGQTIGVQLAALYAATGAPRTVYSSGYGGQGSASILARLGAAPSFVTLPVGASGFPEIPASGAVNVTVTANPLAYADPAQTKSIPGTLAGIPGTLAKAGTTGQYSFTRATSGSIVITDAGIPFVPSTSQYKYWTSVCWIGTNDLPSKTSTELMAFIASYFSWQVTSQKRRIVIMPTFDSLSGSVAATKTKYADLLTLVKVAYPYEYIDTLSILQRNNNGSADDLADIASGFVPRSLQAADRYHLNLAGYGVLAAEIKHIFDSKGF